MTDLQKACEETAITLASPELESMVTRLEAFEMCKEAFNEALRPEHIKHTEAVKGLIDLLGQFLNSDDAMRILDVDWLNRSEEALKPFEKETE